MTARMTDREAIRRLAEIVARVADCIPAELARADALALERDLAEPAAPTVTRFQASQIQRVCSSWMEEHGVNYGIGSIPQDWSDFFRAVADALEGE